MPSFPRKLGQRYKIMIEVEKKFSITPEELARLTAGAEFIGEKEFTDVYYDAPDHTLTKKGFWLRNRAGRFELKIPLEARDGNGMDKYEELEDEGSIAERLGLPTGENFVDAARGAGYVPFATITTKRAEYKKEGFTIDMNDFGYHRLLEIELMVENEAEMDEAERKIVAFASAQGLSARPVRSKMIEYLARNDPAHFHALEAAWGTKL